MAVRRRTHTGRDPLLEDTQLRGAILGGDQHAGFHPLAPLLQWHIFGIIHHHRLRPFINVWPAKKKTELSLA
jgi:hypothetical protein